MNVIFAVTTFMKPIYEKLADFIGQKGNVGTLPEVKKVGGKDVISEADKNVLKNLIEAQYKSIRGMYLVL